MYIFPLLLVHRGEVPTHLLLIDKEKNWTSSLYFIYFFNIIFYIQHIKHQLFNYSFLIFNYISHLHNCTFIFYFLFCFHSNLESDSERLSACERALRECLSVWGSPCTQLYNRSCSYKHTGRASKGISGTLKQRTPYPSPSPHFLPALMLVRQGFLDFGIGCPPTSSAASSWEHSERGISSPRAPIAAKLGAPENSAHFAVRHTRWFALWAVDRVCRDPAVAPVVRAWTLDAGALHGRRSQRCGRESW